MSYAIASSVTATRQVIEPLISTAWVTGLGYSADSIAWPDTTFQTPGNGPWMRVSFTDQSTTPFEWGGGTVLNTTVGVLQLQIFFPKNTGSALLNVAVDKFRATFERKAFGAGIRFRETFGPSYPSNDRWANALVQLPFEYYEAITL